MAIPSENSIKPLKECFTKIIKQEPLNLTVKNVIKILENDLSIDTKNLDEHLIKTVLPNMIAHFIGSWPGWNKSNEYFTVNHLIKTSYQQALGELKQEKAEEDKAKAKTHLSHTVQTDDSIMKNFAPFCLGITCPPQLFNTLAFDAINEDHVHVQAHRPIPWSTLTIKEVIHWPNVAVVFESPYFSFRREVCIEYQRHFSAAKAWHKFVKNDFIKRITIIDENIKRKCYAANFIETFLICYKQILERLSEDELAKDAYHDISFLFNTFLMDIKEINIKDSIPTNTSIVFNIGKSVFTRNKKVKETATQSDVTYIEMITPYIELKLNKFDIKQNTTNPRSILAQTLPKITFECTFCQLTYPSKNLIILHLYENHHMEQCVLCSCCKLGFKVEQLAAARWTHNCG